MRSWAARLAMLAAAWSAGGGSGCGKKGESPCVCPEVAGTRAAAPLVDAGAVRAAEGTTDETEARTFLEREYVPALRRLERLVNLAAWNAYVTGREDMYKAREDAEVLYRRFHSDREAFGRVKALRDSPGVTDPQVRRQLEVAWLQYLDNQVDPELNARIVELATRIEERFNTFRAEFRGVKKTDNELKTILRTTTSSDEAREAWEALKQVGTLVADDLVALAELRNEAAHQVGFPDFATLQLAVNEQTPEGIKDLFDRVAVLTDQPFRRWKAEIDAELAARFGVAIADLRPWHYGDPFFQDAPPVPGLDPDEFWRGKDVLAVARAFYAGIGLDVEPILARSDLYERAGKVQHAFCFDIDRAGDIRILLNLKADARWAETTLHELGHAVYDAGIDPDLPYPLRGAAHALTTEGIAMLFGGLTLDPQWLAAAAGVQLDPPTADKLRRHRIRSWLVFARWALVMTDFERELYANPRQDLAALWWDLVRRHQLLTPPEDRAGQPDWATKIHLVVAPVYYHNYLLGELFAAQLRAHIAREVLQASSPGDIVLVGRPEVGRWLVEHVFRPARTLRWDVLIERVTGRPLSPEAFVAQME